MRRASEVVDYLKLIRSEMSKNAQVSNLQKEQLFYQMRYTFIDELITRLEEIINGRK